MYMLYYHVHLQAYANFLSGTGLVQRSADAGLQLQLPQHHCGATGSWLAEGEHYHTNILLPYAHLSHLLPTVNKLSCQIICVEFLSGMRARSHKLSLQPKLCP